MDSWSSTKQGTFRGGNYAAPERTPATPEPWMEDALCAQTDPEAFFPEKGGSTRDAKRLCQACPVAAECLTYALTNDERFGIWGGLSERERRKVKRGAPVPVMRERPVAVQVLDPEAYIPFEDRPLSGRTTWTHGQNARMKQLVAEGASDRQIAKAMRVKVHTIWNWRSRAGLVPNVEKPVAKAKPPRRVYHRWTEDDLRRIRDLHAEGVSDSQIAKIIGRGQADVSKKRKAMGLPALGHFGGQTG